MSPMNLIKNAEGKINLSVKIAGLLFTAGTVIFAGGKFVGNTNRHGLDIDKLDTRVTSVDQRVNGLEKNQTRHEILDSLLMYEVREMRGDVKQLIRRR